LDTLLWELIPSPGDGLGIEENEMNLWIKSMESVATFEKR
jgi:hypothetical protein